MMSTLLPCFLPYCSTIRSLSRFKVDRLRACSLHVAVLSRENLRRRYCEMAMRSFEWSKKSMDQDVENDMRLSHLEVELDEAIRTEDFTTAARLRDELRSLQSASSVEVLNANMKFYKSFDQGSLLDMAGCWLQDKNVTCKHPLGPLSVGYMSVLDSFSDLFSAGVPDIVPNNVRISMRGSVALVTCEEVASGHGDEEARAAEEAHKNNPNFDFVTVSVVMLATNIFAKRNGQWYLIHHSSSPKFPSDSLK